MAELLKLRSCRMVSFIFTQVVVLLLCTHVCSHQTSISKWNTCPAVGEQRLKVFQLPLCFDNILVVLDLHVLDALRVVGNLALLVAGGGFWVLTFMTEGPFRVPRRVLREQRTTADSQGKTYQRSAKMFFYNMH